MRNCPLLFLLIFSCSYFGLFADSKIVLPFKIGEKLEYDLSWGFFPVGEATMEVHSLEKIDGELCYLIRFSVRTNSIESELIISKLVSISLKLLLIFE